MCPSGTVPGIEDGCFTGFCIPKTQCGPSNPGSCTDSGSGAMCNMAPPKCPVDTVPGINDGCWTGFCIPADECPVPACETLTSESACDARTDCQSVFNGTSCTCTEDGTCTCASETWARCETLLVSTPPVPQPMPYMPAIVRHYARH